MALPACAGDCADDSRRPRGRGAVVAGCGGRAGLPTGPSRQLRGQCRPGPQLCRHRQRRPTSTARRGALRRGTGRPAARGAGTSPRRRYGPADPAECIHRLERAIDLARRRRIGVHPGPGGVGYARRRASYRRPPHALRLFRTCVRGWQRSGSWFQQWTTLRTLAALLSELDADEQAAVLLGAADAAPGRTRHRCAPKRSTTRPGAGSWRSDSEPQRFAEMTAWGAAQPRTAIVDYALQAIESVAPDGI